MEPRALIPEQLPFLIVAQPRGISDMFCRYSIEQMSAWPSLGTHAEIIRRNYLASYDFKDFAAVYAVWCATTLLYIGSSVTVRARIKTHCRRPTWRRTTVHYQTHATALRCESINAAAALEAELIRAHAPPWNSRFEPEGGQVRRRA